MYLGIYTREEKMCLQGAVFLRNSIESVVSIERLLHHPNRMDETQIFLLSERDRAFGLLIEQMDAAHIHSRGNGVARMNRLTGRIYSHQTRSASTAKCRSTGSPHSS